MSNNKFMVIIHYNGQMVKTDVGVVFDCESSTKMRFEKEIMLREMKEKISQKIRIEIHGLRYRWMTCDNPVRYCAITLQDDDDVSLMIAEHDSMGIRYIELFAEVRDVPGPSTNVVGESAQMNFGDEIDMPGGSFVAMLTSGTSNAFYEAEPLTYASSHGPSVDPTVEADVEPSRGRWGESLADSSEDEDIGDHNLFPDDVGAALDFGVGEFVSSGGDITFYEPPSHMSSVDFDAMRAPEFSDLARLTSSQHGELYVKLQFDDKNEAILAVKEYNIKNHVDYFVAESSTRTFFSKCVKYGQECNWKIRVTKLQRSNRWEVTKYNGGHICLRTSINQDHRKLDSNVICRHIMKLVEANPQVTVSTIQESIAQQFKYQIKYKKAWRARDKEMDLVYGDYDKSYNELLALLLALTHFIPGTIVRYQTKDAKDREGQIVEGYKFFHRLFWAFKPAIEGFPYCKRMIQVDGTWLYGRYSHILLVAVTQDGDNNIFPIAFAIVEQETAEAWNFFLTNLREHVVKEDVVCIISDRGTGIKAAINRDGSRWTPPNAYPAYCIRHISKNCYERFKNPYLRSEIESMGYLLTRPHFERKMENLMKYDEQVWSWANEIERERWAQSYDEGGRRYGKMTTNLMECINGVLKESRHLPIASLVKETYYRLAKVWVVKGKEIEALLNMGQRWAPALVTKMTENMTKAMSLKVHSFDRTNQTFDVVGARRNNEAAHSNVFRVDFRHSWCDCGAFQAWRYPCIHAIASCMHVGVDPYTFVDECFDLRRMVNIYRSEFPPIANSIYWSSVEHEKWLPDPTLRRSPNDRPRSTRIYTSMDLHFREKGQRKRCTICRAEGHSKSNCPNEPRFVSMPR